MFEAVTFSRGAEPLFLDFSLTLRERRIGFIGDNGSGKSSLLRLVNGLLLPDRGRVLVNGLDTRADRRSLPAEVGFVFQNADHQIIFPTVAEEMAFALLERGLDGEAARRRALAVLCKHGCETWEGRAVHELSDGQKQLLCILAVVAAEPSIVLLDEPFASLDLPTKLALSATLAALPQQVLMASHDHALLAEFDRVIWLDNGAVRMDGRPKPVLAAYRDHATAAQAVQDRAA